MESLEIVVWIPLKTWLWVLVWKISQSMQIVCQMPKPELSFGQRMGKKKNYIFMYYSWKHPICKRNCKKKDIRDSTSPIYVFSMQPNSVQPGFLLFAVRFIQGNTHLCCITGKENLLLRGRGLLPFAVARASIAHPHRLGWKWVKGYDTFADVRWVWNVRLVLRNRLWCASAAMGWWHGR